MARYDYRCPACNTQFEVEHPMAEHPEVLCPACGAKAQQVFGTSSIVFKGSGFYNTDQRGSKGPTEATGAPKDSASGSSAANKSAKSAPGSSDATAGTTKGDA